MFCVGLSWSAIVGSVSRDLCECQAKFGDMRHLCVLGGLSCG